MEIRYKYKPNREFSPLGETFIIPTEYGSPVSLKFERNSLNETSFSVYKIEKIGDRIKRADEPLLRLFVKSDMDWKTYFGWLDTLIEEICINDVRIYPVASAEE